tara:strand:- start:1368 stop:1553 length:186 start_codon:yes stop_codon:yes gene_type:complete
MGLLVHERPRGMVERRQVDKGCSTIDPDSAPTMLCCTHCPHALAHFSATDNTVATISATSA